MRIQNQTASYASDLSVTNYSKVNPMARCVYGYDFAKQRSNTNGTS